MTVKICLLFLLASVCYGADILAILPFQGTSHFFPFAPLLDELAKKGHKMTVASYFPKVNPFPNYRDVSLVEEGTTTKGFFNFSFVEGTSSGWSNVKQLLDIHSFYDRLFELPQFLNLANQKFDLVITEYFNSDIALGIIYKIGAPFIFLTTADYLPWHNDAISNSNNPSYRPFSEGLKPAKMGFFDRFINTLEVYGASIAYKYIFRPKAQKMSEKHLGPLPDFGEIAKNVSLFLVNAHFSLYGPRNTMSNSIEVGGLNIKPPKPLPQELKKIMDESEGVIYFSMGSVLRGDSMSAKTENMLVKVFSELNQTVLWKRETDIKQKVKNIRTSGWYPQRDILEHPKVVLFISHCGLLSTNEASASGLPMIGLPMFGDQHHNIKAVEALGVGLGLDFWTLDEDDFRRTINKVLNNPSYKENALNLKKAFWDRPLPPLDTAVYWVEYVLRHQGAPHLQNPAKHLTWYQYHNLDVIALMIAIVYIAYKILKLSIRIMLSVLRPSSKKKVKQH